MVSVSAWRDRNAATNDALHSCSTSLPFLVTTEPDVPLLPRATGVSHPCRFNDQGLGRQRSPGQLVGRRNKAWEPAGTHGAAAEGVSQLCTNWAYQGHGPISIYQNGLHYKRVVRPAGQKESSCSIQPTRKLPNPSLAATQVLEERRLLWSIWQDSTNVCKNLLNLWLLIF